MTKTEIFELKAEKLSHQHGCGTGGHMYECHENCVCICDLPMNGNDHSNCPIEIRDCPEEHPTEETLPEAVVEIEFPTNLRRSMVSLHCQCGCADADSSQVVGWCLWCDHVYTEFTPAIQEEHFAQHCLKALHN
jgi:hypothetical protein